MLKEIAAATLALYRLSGVTVPAETAASGRRSQLITLELIRANFEHFERAIARIADQPLRRLRSFRRWVPAWESTRIDDRALAEAFRRGDIRRATAQEARAAPGYVAALKGQWAPVVAERSREEHTATYENEAIAGFLRWLQNVLGRASKKLSGENVSDVIWKARISSWRIRIASLQSRDVFADIRPTPFLRATSVFRMHPDYATAFTAMMRMRGGLGAGSALAPAVPIDETFRLYELWFYVVLLGAAAERFPNCRQHVAKLLAGLESADQLGTTLSQGTGSAIQLTPSISLTYQRRFTPMTDAQGARTLLIEAVPDVVIARTDEHNRAISMIIFDPKYRRGASLLDGVRDLHVYRDAILGDQGPLTHSAIAVAPTPGSLQDVPVFRTDRPTIFGAKPGPAQSDVQQLLLEAQTILEQSSTFAAEATDGAVVPS